MNRTPQAGPELDAWIRFDERDTLTLFTSKVEIGQGIRTALLQIAAEELDVDPARIRVASADTDRSPSGSSTVGSNSIQTEGDGVRRAAADVRRVLLEMASERLGAPVERLTVEDGTVRDRKGAGRTTYWDLAGGRRLRQPVTGVGKPKPPSAYRVVGRAMPRTDLPDRVTGKPCFIQDMTLPGMAHGRVVRPPGYGARLVEVDEAGARAVPGVLAVVRNGSFLGVVAEREEQAVKAAEVLRAGASWELEAELPDREALYEHLLSGPDQAFHVVEGAPVEGPVPAVEIPGGASKTIEATYYRPYQMHAALGPSAAMAQLEGERLTVWSHTQGVHSLRGALAQVLDMADESVRVVHADGAGCYGHNGADDAALDAALLAQAVPGRPVLLKWMREDEHAWEPSGSCMVVKMQGSLNSDGETIDWNHDVWSYTHSGRPRAMEGVSSLLAAQHISPGLPPPAARPGTGSHGGIHRNADPLYAFARRRIVKHFVPDSPLRVSAMRGLGAYANLFAIESFMDELAFAAGADPVAFRLRHLADPRAREVIEAAAERAGWVSGVRSGNGGGRGQGIGFAQYKNQKCYVAVVADVEVDPASGKVRLERMVIAGDAGRIVNPDGVASQLEGGVVQAASWTLKEAVAFDRKGVTSRDWEAYPVLTFLEAPEVETVLLDRPEEPSLGCGEATQGPTAGAIANALFDATGVRFREIPFTPERVAEGLSAKG